MDEGFLKTLEQITGILTGYCAGVRAGTALNSQSPVNSPHNQVRRHENSNNLETNCKFIQFIPRAARLVPLAEDIKEVMPESVSSALPQQKEEENLKYIIKRSDGRWCARRTINGKRVYVYGKTQVEVYEKLKKLGTRKPRVKQYVFYDFALYWAQTYKKGQVAEKTYRDYINIINCHLKIKTPLNKITLMQFQEILNALSASRIREAVYQVAKAVIRKAYELDFIKKDFSAFLVKGKVEKGSRRALTLDEQYKLLNALSDDTFSRRVIFYLCTGARPAEIATVSKDELRRCWVKINGTKTKSAIRWVKISEKLSSMLSSESSDFFKFDAKRFRERLQRICHTAGINYDVDTYTLRHTFATNLYILRVPEKDRQTYMGHVAGSLMTNNVYTTFSPDTTPEDVYKIYKDWYPKF